MKRYAWITILVILLTSACSPAGLPDAAGTAFQNTEEEPDALPSSTSNLSTEETNFPVSSQTPLPSRTHLPSSPTPRPSSAAVEMDAAGSPAPNHPYRPESIYVYDDVAYGTINYQDGYQNFISPIRPLSEDVTRPSIKTISFAFSHYTEQVAYITLEGNVVTLWIGDLNLNNVNQVWKDDQKWLDYDRSSWEEIKLNWLVVDQFLLVSYRASKIFYALNEQRVVQLSGTCNTIAKSPQTSQFAIWCPVFDEKNVYALERDGSYWMSASLPDNRIQVQDWNFSPSGEEILYAAEDGELVILVDSGDTILPGVYVPPRWDITMRVLQWSRSGERILAYVQNNGSLICPSGSPCWAVFDVLTGDTIWAANGEVAYSNFDAALSPDGESVVLFVLALPFRYGYIVSVETNEITPVADFLVEAVHWGK